MLASLVLALYHYICRKIGYAYSRFCFVYMLTACAACTEIVYFQVGGIYLKLYLVSLDEYSYGNS